MIRLISSFLAAAGIACVLHAQTDVLTQHNDRYRTGWNPTESILTPSAVQSGAFRLLYSFPVNGQIYAQPLVVANYSMLDPRTGDMVVRDLLLVCTAHNTVYCFDTRKPSGPPVWVRTLGKSVPSTAVGCDDLKPEIGIISTPVIDRETGTLYVVAKIRTATIGPTIQQAVRLHALDLTTGKDKANSPVALQGSVPGTAPDAVNGQVRFDPSRQMNRPGLLLDRGRIFIASGGHCDYGPFHGWLFAYDASTLQRLGVFCTTPDGDPGAGIPSGAGGIWMCGQGVACDDNGDVYFSSGNGAFSADNSGRQVGNSFVRLSFDEGGFKLVTFFTPHDTLAMNQRDRDVGAAGVLLIPGTNLAVGGGKDKDLYVMNRDDMGGFHNGVDNVLQRWLGTNDGTWVSSVYWSSVQWGKVVVTGGKEDFIQARRVQNGLLQQTPFTTSTVKGKWPGSAMSISSNGSDNAIVWSLSRIGDQGILRAFNANDLSQLLWDSDVHPGDEVGLYAKFCPPTVANGKVFVPTFSGKVNVYGLTE